MARRSFALGFLAASLLAAGALIGLQAGQQRTADAAPKEEARPLRAGYVSVSDLMKGYEKWQAKSAELEEKRQKSANELIRMRDHIEAQTKKVEKADAEDKPKLEKELREARRQFEDTEATLKGDLDKQASAALLEMFNDIVMVVEKLATERGLDVIYFHPAHPKRGFEQLKGHEQQFIDMLMRSTAMNPIYLRDELDLTADLVKRLNAKADREKK